MKYCNGDCHQGRKPCPTPQACFIPDDALEPKIDWAFIAYNVVLILLCIAMAVWTLWGAKWN